MNEKIGCKIKLARNELRKLTVKKKSSPGWVVGSKSLFRDCLQQSKMIEIRFKKAICGRKTVKI